MSLSRKMTFCSWFWVKKINFCFMLPSTPKELETPIFVTFRIKMLSNFTQPLTFRSSDTYVGSYSMVKQNWPPAQKYAINKKSTIFTQFLWHFVKMTIPWDDHFSKVSSKLGENCGFFINSIFLGRGSISLQHTV